MQRWRISLFRTGHCDPIDLHKPVELLNQTREKAEVYSVKVRQFLKKEKYSKVVELLRELPQHTIRQLLESFPFKALNEAIPKSFPIWETLLSKLHSSEEGYITQFPYAACDELVIHVAQLVLIYQTDKARDNSQLLLQCRRVLKQVYMQYHEVLQHLMKENERLSRAFYSLGFHVPLGSEPTAPSLHYAIRCELEASLKDYKDSIVHIDELMGDEILSLSQVLKQDCCLDSDSRMERFPSRKLNQTQIQERLHFNKMILQSISPSRRNDNFSELLEMLNARIEGDKEVLALYGGIRERNKWINDTEQVEPWLLRYQRSIESTITILKEIEDELAIKSPPTSPNPAQDVGEFRHLHLNLQPPIPLNSSTASSPEAPLASSHHLCNGHNNIFEGLIEEDASPAPRQRSVSCESCVRPNSVELPCSRSRSKSSLSINKKGNENLKKGTSASAQDIPSTVHNMQSASLPRTTTPSTVHAIAGRKKRFEPLRRSLRNSLRRLYGSTGSMHVNFKPRKKISRTSSGGDMEIDVTLDYASLEDELDRTKSELYEAMDTIQTLRRRERELTDRLSEQAQRHLQDSEKFEDILIGASRPTQVAQRYQELYSQTRVEAYEAIEFLLEEHNMENTLAISEFLLDTLKLAYSAAKCELDSLHKAWKRNLVHESHDRKYLSSVRQLESAVNLHLKKVSSTHNPKEIISMTEWDLGNRYGNHPQFSLIMELAPVVTFLKECSQLAWDMMVQSPPMIINVNEREFIPELHTRFFEANKKSSLILYYLWPTLMQSSSGVILNKGMVVT